MVKCLSLLPTMYSLDSELRRIFIFMVLMHNNVVLAGGLQMRKFCFHARQNNMDQYHSGITKQPDFYAKR